MSYAPRTTDNPPADQISEPTGLVAKDSLANESIQAGGGFADNENPEVIGVKGAQSTLNNTDTSNADTLPPASSREARDGDDTTQYPDAGAGQGFEGTTSDQGYRGGSGDAGLSSASSGHSGSATGSSGAGVRPYVETAPNYAMDSTTTGDLQPKGDNLVEGGDIPADRDTYTGDVGGSKDPGRLAEREFVKMNEDGSGGTGARDYTSGEGGVGYDNLKSSERA